jgi:RNA polymerase sigma-70 factor (ECF subfamily)
VLSRFPVGDPDFAGLYEQHRSYLWALCYRLTGDGDQADDLVQEVFARAIERPPQDRGAPWRPWLVKVATNCAIDALRKRRNEPYPGPWLPQPVSSRDWQTCIDFEPQANAEARYSALESASLAFLLALEALGPTARAIVLLRDVFSYSGRETAELLDMSEANVRVQLHRARSRLAAYDHQRIPIVLSEPTRVLLQRFVIALQRADMAELLDCLAPDVALHSDAGGVYRAASRPVFGRTNVVKLLFGLARKGPPLTGIVPHTVNGVFAWDIRFESNGTNIAPRQIVTAALDADGTIEHLFFYAAPAKLRRI